MAWRTQLLVAFSLIFGLSYGVVGTYQPETAATIAAKTAGVGLLALAAALEARKPDERLLALLLALGATGDLLIEISLGAGAAAFALAHIASILLYLRNRRPAVGRWNRAFAAALPLAAAALAFGLLRGRPEALPFAAYAVLLGAMAASAWLSRFRRPLVGLGATLFLASDMLIALRIATGSASFSPAVWLLYYVGQLMIFLGVRSSPAAKPVGRGTTRSVVEG